MLMLPFKRLIRLLFNTLRIIPFNLQEMNKVYGYCRISTPKQNIERQVRNILKEYPDAMIVQETYSGTHYQGRKELEKLIRTVQVGDTIIFDSVSRMSRNIEMALHQHGHLQEDFAGEADFSQHRERRRSC